MGSVGKTPYNLTELSQVFLALLCIRGLNIDSRMHHPDQRRRERFRAPVKKKIGAQLARADRLKILTLIRKDWLSLSLGLKVLICTPDITEENKTYAEQSGPGPFPDSGAPVICTASPSPLVGTDPDWRYM